MGAWGDGPFENDHALDTFGNHFDPLVYALHEAVLSAHTGDGLAGIDDVVALAEMVAVVGGLTSHQRFCTEDVEIWRDAALGSIPRELGPGPEWTEDKIREFQRLALPSFERLATSVDPDTDMNHEGTCGNYRYWCERVGREPRPGDLKTNRLTRQWWQGR